jgi:Protein of unknown function (DUF3592)
MIPSRFEEGGMESSYALGVLVLLGVVFAGPSAFRLAHIGRLRRAGAAAVGVVVGQREGFSPGDVDGGGMGLTQAPVVRFTTRAGQRVEVTPSARTNNSSFIPGRPVTVHYDPAEPHKAVIGQYEAGIYRILLAVGVVLLLVAAAIVLVPPAGWQPVLDLFPALLPIALGLLFAGIAALGIRRVVRIQASGASTSGVVVGETTSSTRSGITLHHPVVRYVVPGGPEVEVPSFRGTMAVRTTPGQQVTVRYDPADPGMMLLKGDGPEPIFLIFAFVGVVAFAVGVAIAYLLLT